MCCEFTPCFISYSLSLVPNPYKHQSYLSVGRSKENYPKKRHPLDKHRCNMHFDFHVACSNCGVLFCCTCEVITKYLFAFVSYHRPVQLLQCVHNPDHTDCRFCTNTTATPWKGMLRTVEGFRYLCVKLEKMWLRSLEWQIVAWCVQSP